MLLQVLILLKTVPFTGFFSISKISAFQISPLWSHSEVLLTLAHVAYLLPFYVQGPCGSSEVVLGTFRIEGITPANLWASL